MSHRSLFRSVSRALIAMVLIQRQRCPLPRKIEYFAHLGRVGDRARIATNEKVLHGARSDRV
jgi:hypothetical protein